MTLRDIFSSIIDYDLSNATDMGIGIVILLGFIGAAIWITIELIEYIKGYEDRPIETIFYVTFMALIIILPVIAGLYNIFIKF